MVSSPIARRRFMQLVAAALPYSVGAASGGSSRIANVRDYGARGDGVSDDTAAFAAALATGCDVFVPSASHHYAISRSLALSKAGQRVFGEGARSHVVQWGMGANSSVLVTSHPGCVFEGLHLSPGASARNLGEGWGVLIIRTHNVTIRECRFSRTRHGGIALFDSSGCQVSRNVFLDSVVRGDGSEPQSQTGFDVYLNGDSSRNLVSENKCLSGTGVGIGCQTAVAGKRQIGNSILSNVVRNQPAYGIMIYGIETEQNIEDFRIERNVVEGISGSVKTDGTHRFYGAGIYAASGNHFSIRHNTIRDTNTDRRLPYSSGAVPAAIAISGFGDGAVEGNTIDGCYNGIMSVQTLVGGVADRTIINGNTIGRCHHTGILLLDSVGASVSHNALGGGAGAAQGIYAALVLARHRGTLDIADNRIKEFPIGVEVREGAPRARITRNQIANGTGYAIYSAADETVIEANEVRGGRGIALGAQVKRGTCQANVIDARETPILNQSRGQIVMERNTVLRPVG